MTPAAVPEGHAVHPEQGGGSGQEVLHLQPQVCHQQRGDNCIKLFSSSLSTNKVFVPRNPRV
jgi:hypothetical protein